jgi:HD-like signal output (HDOD) protein/GGDEF domain-containing protein
MSDSSTNSVLQQFVDRSRKLYSLPAVALEVIELTNQPTVDTRALKECIEKDPALTIRLLRVVNSSLFGLSRQVSDLNQALALLGIKPLKMLVLGFSLPKDLTEGIEAKTLRRYWQHTVVKAVACRLLAERLGGVSGDEAFLAGLLQDIGQLALIQDLGPPYVRFLEHVHDQQGDVLAMELETLGFDHAVLSSRLLAGWQLPTALAAAVASSHDAQQIAKLPPPQRRLPQILHLGELIARAIDFPGPASLDQLLSASREYAALGFEQLDALAATLHGQVVQLASALSLDLPETTPYTELLRAAHERLAEVALEGALALASAAAEQRVLDEARSLRDQLQAAIAGPRQARPHSDAIVATHAAAKPAPHVVDTDDGREPSKTTVHLHPVSPKKSSSTHDDEPGLLGRVAAAISHARVSRRPVSLALLQVDDWQSAIVALGPQAAVSTLRMLETALNSWTHERGSTLATGDAQFALVWEDCSRREALDLVRQLQSAIHAWQPSGDPVGLTLSIGVATLSLAPKNFPPQELIEAARRCLSGAQLSGGNSAKSIEF